MTLKIHNLIIISLAIGIQTADLNLKSILKDKLQAIRENVMKIKTEDFVTDQLVLTNITVAGIDQFEVKRLAVTENPPVIHDLTIIIDSVTIRAKYRLPPVEILGPFVLYGEGKWSSILKGITLHLQADMDQDGSIYSVKEIFDVSCRFESASVQVDGLLGSGIVSGITSWLLSYFLVLFANKQIQNYLDANREVIKQHIDLLLAVPAGDYDLNATERYKFKYRKG